MSHYDTLGISPDASRREIQRAYREQFEATRPERVWSFHGTRHAAVTDAYAALSNPAQRHEYDMTCLAPTLPTVPLVPKAAPVSRRKGAEWADKPQSTLRWTAAAAIIIGAVICCAPCLLFSSSCRGTPPVKEDDDKQPSKAPRRAAKLA